MTQQAKRKTRAARAEMEIEKPRVGRKGANSPHPTDDQSSGDIRATSQRSAPLTAVATAVAVAVAIIAAAAGLDALPRLGGGGELNESQKKQREEKAAADALRTYPLTIVSAHEREKALATMNLTKDERAAVEEGLLGGQIEIAWVTLIDNLAQDGDVVGFRSDLWPQVNVTALHQPTTIAVVYPSSGCLTAVGVHDGGGGITVDVITDGTQASYPAMSVGETHCLPVAPR